MKFTPPLIQGTLIQRYKRFLADINLSDQAITAHCANPGSMMGLKDAGMTVWVSVANNPKRKLQWDWQIAQIGEAMIGINTGLPNRLVEEALLAGTLEPLSGYSGLRREVKYGTGSRIDFLLSREARPDCYVEVKSVTLSRQAGHAEFPDSVTARGLKHLGELSLIAQSGQRAVMLYLMQRNDCTQFSIADDLDPKYAAGLKSAMAAGVEVLVYACEITPEAITVGARIMDIDV